MLGREPERRLSLGLGLNIVQLLLEIPPLLHLRVLRHCLQQLLVLLVGEGQTLVRLQLVVLVPAAHYLLLGLLLGRRPVLVRLDRAVLDGGRGLLLLYLVHVVELRLDHLLLVLFNAI